MKTKLLNLNLITFLLILFVLTANTDSAFASKNPPIELSGKIKSIKLNQEDKNHISYDLTFEMEFINKSNCTILLSNRKPWVNSQFIASTAENLSKKEYMYSSNGYPANSISEEWENFRRELDNPVPPQKHFTYLLPNQSWRFEVETALEITKMVNNGDGFIIDAWNKVNWSEIKSSPELWLQLEINLWFSNIEPLTSREEIQFGKKLRNNWKTYGYLWLDDVKSNPILLDLNSVYKGL